jgi:signal recognition particle receptor subunit beta
MFINHSSKEVTAKIVYYGPGLSGKTTNLQYIFSITNPKTRGELISIETEIERTLFFDLLPVNVGLVKGYQTKFQLYTVPGQVFYDSTRKLVLKGADGIVFVADSQELMKTANLESLENLKKNLGANKLDIADLPMVFQFNKRDLNNTLPLEDLNRLINQKTRPYFSAVATEGTGVIETLRSISGLILKEVKSLLEHQEIESGNTPVVDFDTDRQQQIIDKENLPLKKIHTEDLEAASQQIEGKPMDVGNADVPEIPEDPFDITPEPLLDEPGIPEEDDDMLTVETIGPVNEYQDLEELVLGDEMTHVEEVAEFEEIDSGNDIGDVDENMPKQAAAEPGGLETAPVEEDTNELVNDAGTGTLKNVKSPLGDVEPVDEGDAFDLPDLEQIDETEESAVPPPPPEPLSPAAFEPPPPPPPPPPPSMPPEPVEEPERAVQIEKPAAEKETAAASGKRFNLESGGMDLFDRLKDKTRVTVIRTVPVEDSKLIIDIKDKDSLMLDSIHVKITPETKKVTLILDVKK